MTPLRLRKGTLISVDWLDAASDVTGNPDEAAMQHWRSVGWFSKTKTQKSLKCLVLSLNRSLNDDKVEPVSGWLTVPWGWITDLHILEEPS